MKRLLKHCIIGFLGLQLILCVPDYSVYAETFVATDSNASKTESELSYIKELEALAEEYKSIADEKERFQDTRKEIMVYIRSKQYKSTAWNICAGDENKGFSEYVSGNNKDIEKLRTLGTFNTPYTNEKSKFVHFFGALNMAYNGYGELGSWAGDLVQLTKNIKDRQPTDAEVEDLATDLLCGKSQFTSEEMVADIDAINIAAVLKEEEIPVSQAIDEYYMTLKGSDQTERYRLFVKNQFELDYVSKEKLIRETSKIMKEDVLIDILFDNYNVSLNNPSDTIYVDAAINAFVEYIFKNCPEEMIVEDSFFPSAPESDKENNVSGSGSGSTNSSGSSGNGSGGGSSTHHTNLSKSGPGMNVSMSGNWTKDEYGWYFLTTSGEYPKGSWQYLEYDGKKNWYYFNMDGYMLSGWQYIDNSWYYLHQSGEMLTGWQQIDGLWYYMDSSGKMLNNTITPDGYKVDINGKWIQ